MPDATLTAAEGTSENPLEAAPSYIPRALYLHVNKAVQAISVQARALYLAENLALQAIAVTSRSLYLYESLGIQALTVLRRALYLHEATRDTEVFPWLMLLEPDEQYELGQVDLYGDGLGELLEVAGLVSTVVTVDSVNGGYVADNVKDRSGGSWVSNGGPAAWVRLTFDQPRTIRQVALEAAGNGWGVPLFRFSDGGVDVNGGVAVPSGVNVAPEYPVGYRRQLYTLPAPRTTTYLEVRIASGGAASFGGLYEVWAWADVDQAAENSIPKLGTLVMGIAAWSGRSPGLWPANGGQPITPAATVTVPAGGESGLVTVHEDQ